MAEVYFPFQAGAGTSVTEAYWSMMARLFVGSGVVKGALNELQVYADSSGMQVKVKSGRHAIMGLMYQSDAEQIIPIAAADPANPRIDVIALRLDWVANTIAVVALEGTPAANPVAPALTQTDILITPATARWDIALASVNVPAAAATIAAANVTDARTFTGAPTSTPTAGATVQYDKNGNLAANRLIAVVNPNLLVNPTFALKDYAWAVGNSSFTFHMGTNGIGAYLAYLGTTTSSVVQVDNSIFRVPSSSNATYTLSGDMYTLGVTAGDIGIQWWAFDVNGNALNGGTVLASNGTDWTRYSITFTTPANTASVRVACVVDVNSNISGQGAAWKKLKLEVGSQATVYSDDNTLNNVQYAPYFITPTYQNGWGPNGDASFSDAYFWKDIIGMVHVRGLAKCSASGGSGGAAIFTLPAGMRPKKSYLFSAVSNDAYADISVDAYGVIAPRQNIAANAWMNLSNIDFYAEQ